MLPQDLQLDQLDLYLMHWPLAFQPGPAGFGKIRPGITLQDTWRAMEVGAVERARGVGAVAALASHVRLMRLVWRCVLLLHAQPQALVDAGLVRHLGVSNFTEAHLRDRRSSWRSARARASA